MIQYNLQLFAKDGPGGAKTEPASQKKLDDARKEGQVAKSKELVSALSLLAFFIVLKVYVGMMGEKLMGIFTSVYNLIPKIVADTNFSYNLLIAAVEQEIVDIIIIILPIVLVGFVVAFVSNVFQFRWQITSKPLMPKLSKLSPLSGFKRIFSTKQLVELLKSIAMMLVIGYMVYATLKSKYELLLTLYDRTLMQAALLTGEIIIDLGIKISAVFLIVGAADFFYQKYKFSQDMKMTKQEVKDEYKQSEGDPQIKGQIKRRMQEASRRRMMQAVPEADVVITNPTHFAVALKYEANSGRAPIVVAKGADYLAQQIKEKAKEFHVEIVENKPLARLLYNNVDIDCEIPQELYQAVAEVLAYVYALKNH